MEDIIKFVVIAAVAVISLVGQVRKDARKKARKATGAPRPYTPPTTDDWIGGTGPEPHHVPPVPHPPFAGQGQRTPSYHASMADRRPSSPRPAPPPAMPQPPMATDTAEYDDDGNDYRFHSAEEARKAIVWSEILQRKY